MHICLWCNFFQIFCPPSPLKFRPRPKWEEVPLENTQAPWSRLKLRQTKRFLFTDNGLILPYFQHIFCNLVTSSWIDYGQVKIWSKNVKGIVIKVIWCSALDLRWYWASCLIKGVSLLIDFYIVVCYFTRMKICRLFDLKTIFQKKFIS